MNSFTKITATTTLLLLSSIILFAFLGENKAPRVKGEIELEGSKNEAESINQKLIVNFTSPMNQTSVSESFSITPEVRHDIYWVDNRANIYIRENLIYDTEYTVHIKSSAEDVYGNNFKNDYQFSFRTKKRILAIQQRGAEDSIIYTNENFENPEVVFKASDIKLYDATENFVAIVTTPKNSASTLTLKNISKNEEINIPINKSIINSVDLSFKEDLLIFIEQPIEEQLGYVIPGEITQVKIYNIDTGDLSTLELPEYISYILNAEINPDDRSLLIKGPESTYYLVDIYNPDNPVSLGTHLSASGFTSNFQELVLVDAPFSIPGANFPIILTLDNNNKQTRITNGDVYSIDPAHFHNKNVLIYSEQTEGPEDSFDIIEYNKQTQEKRILLEGGNNDLELPRISFDDRFITIERYSEEDLAQYEGLRNIGFLSKPYNATILVYDVLQGKLTGKELTAVNAIWIE